MRRLPTVALGVLIAGYGAIAVVTQLPTSTEQYRELVHNCADVGVSQLGTVLILNQQIRQGRVTGAYASVVLGDAVGELTGAWTSVAGSDVPDDTAAALRDKILPALQTGVTVVGDLDAGHTGVAEHLPELIQELQDLSDATA